MMEGILRKKRSHIGSQKVIILFMVIIFSKRISCSTVISIQAVGFIFFKDNMLVLSQFVMVIFKNKRNRLICQRMIWYLAIWAIFYPRQYLFFCEYHRTNWNRCFHWSFYDYYNYYCRNYSVKSYFLSLITNFSH